MNVTFLFGIVYGRGDSDSWEEDVEITDEDYARIEEACRSGEWFHDCEDVKDIYDRLYDIANLSATETIKEYEPYIIEDVEDPENFKADDLFAICVHWPVGMEERIWDEDEEIEDEE